MPNITLTGAQAGPNQVTFTATNNDAVTYSVRVNYQYTDAAGMKQSVDVYAGALNPGQALPCGGTIANPPAAPYTVTGQLVTFAGGFVQVPPGGLAVTIN